MSEVAVTVIAVSDPLVTFDLRILVDLVGCIADEGLCEIMRLKHIPLIGDRLGLDPPACVAPIGKLNSEALPAASEINQLIQIELA
jgi:hypothetical protein